MGKSVYIAPDLNCLIVHTRHYDQTKRVYVTAKGKPGKVFVLLKESGHWIWSPEGPDSVCGWICSSCGTGYHTKVPYFGTFKYCPECGTLMKSNKNQS